MQPDSLCLHLADADATEQLGATLAHAIEPGMTIYLSGNLGAGKTSLIRALLRARGVSGPIKSPTYTLVEPYVISNLYFYHFDLYRFTDPEEWWDAGFPDYFNPHSVALIEWPEKAAGVLPAPDWHITLQPTSPSPMHTMHEGQAGHGGREFILRTLSERGRICLNQFTAHYQPQKSPNP